MQLGKKKKHVVTTESEINIIYRKSYIQRQK